MFKVVALLAVVGLASAGVTIRDQIAQQNQINTQNAINLNGALRNQVLSGQVVSPLTYSVAGVPALGYSSVAGVPALGYAGVPALGYAGVPALGYSSIAGVPALGYNAVAGVPTLGYNAVGVQSVGVTSAGQVASVRDAVALQNQINTQNAINAQGAVTGAVALNNQIATQTLINGQVPVLTRGVIATGEDVNAINDKINTHIAVQQGIAASNAGALSEGNVVGVVGTPVLSSSVVSVRDAQALNAQIATQNAINAQGAFRNAGVILVQ